MTIGYSILLVLSAALWAAGAGPMAADHGTREREAEDLLAKSMAVYDGLTSYADSGTAMRESVGTFEVSHFRTCLRRPPLSFYFEWGRRVNISSKRAADSLSMPGKQQVFWLVNGDLQTYKRDG